MQTENKPLGAIDALSGGFALIARRPWVLLAPIALNLFLWQGPQISARPLFQQIGAALTLPPTLNPTAETLEGLQTLKQGLQAAGEQFNVFEFIGVAMPGIMPAGAPAAALPRQILFAISDAPSLLALAGAFLLAGFFFLTLYLESIARGVRVTPRVPLLRSFLNILALVFLLSCVGALVLAPLLFVAALVTSFDPAVGSFLVLLVFMLILWVLLYLSFAVPAIVLSGANAAQAIAHSLSIFRWNFWSAMGLVFLVYIIQVGFTVVWEQLGDSPWGMAVDLVANPFLASGLMAGTMLFYMDRVARLAQAQQQAHSSLKG